MASTGPQTVILLGDYGLVREYESIAFPLSRKRDSLGKGDLYLDATLGEILKIVRWCKDSGQHEEMIQSTKDEYDRLRSIVTELENRPKTLHPVKWFRNYRASRLFLTATKKFFKATKSTSEKIARTYGRILLSAADMRAVDVVSPEARIAGIAVNLEGPLDEKTNKVLMDAEDTIALHADPADPVVAKLSSICEDTVAGGSGSSATPESTPPEPVHAEPTPAEPTNPSDNDATNRMSSASNIPQESPRTSAASIPGINLFIGCVLSTNSSLNGTSFQQGGYQNSGPIVYSANVLCIP
ncbi:hypothetical protein BU15DRAFT_83832 [Melanogaster broomeanus]|nr:hypothetical protein BU15DRAFT_83832 [Melanogaster broomeanus]